MSRHGIVQDYQIDCRSKITCDFKLIVTKEMMPQSTVVIYHVSNSSILLQGETIITTNEIGQNKVSQL